MLTLPDVAITRNSIHHMDLFQLCNALGDQSVDMILCDLPYGTTECSWDSVIPMEPMWEQFKRVIKPRGAIVLTATEPFASRLRMSNLGMYKYDWVWVKTSPSDHIRAKLKPMSKHEHILIFSNGTVANCSPNLMYYYPQGTREVNEHHYRPSVFSGNNRAISLRPSHVNEWTRTTANYPHTVLKIPNPNNFNIHPTQKPVALFEYLIKTYTQEGDLVFDPCVGSGTTAVACQNTGRDYICGDFTLEYVELARDRVRNNNPFTATIDRKTGVKQLSLFEGAI